ncbi:hypothetical protein RRG08_059830 [Elysia crispata]|uniref:Uncharacterized protein n=1 Tax=Elysia crispata TaxID=231223 RepID=A0AAE0ZDV8_9GAST|nr:hypothetical protein RRG08_059830 [Elysia crispata]
MNHVWRNAVERLARKFNLCSAVRTVSESDTVEKYGCLEALSSVRIDLVCLILLGIRLIRGFNVRQDRLSVSDTVGKYGCLEALTSVRIDLVCLILLGSTAD